MLKVDTIVDSPGLIIRAVPNFIVCWNICKRFSRNVDVWRVWTLPLWMGRATLVLGLIIPTQLYRHFYAVCLMPLTIFGCAGHARARSHVPKPDRDVRTMRRRKLLCNLRGSSLCGCDTIVVSEEAAVNCIVGQYCGHCQECEDSDES